MTTAEYMAKSAEVAEEAQELMRDRQGEGRNAVVDLSQMFPHGANDTSFVIWMKIARLLGNLEVKNLIKAREEALDIINYAKFTVVELDRVKV